MNLTNILTKQFREVQLDGTWVSTNFKDQISDVTFEEATKKVGNLNTIALLTFHINYYTAGVLNVFKGGSLDIRDKYSFDMPEMKSKDVWEKLKSKFFSDAEEFAKHIEKMSYEKLSEGFVKAEYGNYYRNIAGMIEHSYYHLGQIVLIKKLIRTESLQ